MFPDRSNDIDEFPIAQYGVKLTFNRATMFTVIELQRSPEEEESHDEMSLIERATNEAYNVLGDEFGMSVYSMSLQEVELTLEAVSV